MRVLFWGSLLMIIYTYVGYALLLYVKAKLSPLPIQAAPISPEITILLAVRNEAANLQRKLENLRALNYPADRTEIIVVSDGSTDATEEILLEHRSSRRRVFVLPFHEGKAAALNVGIREARGEIIVFTDARQTLEPDSVRHLLANFADPQVGCASGELMLKPSGAAAETGIGAYWRFEKKMRIWESCSGSVVGGTGALYAVRRDLVQPLPAMTVLDDVYIPLQVGRAGGRVVFDPGARAWDTVTGTTRAEFWRKVRTLTGNYQLVRIAPWVLSGSNPLLFRFISHKLLRLVAPFALLTLLLCSFSLSGTLYQVTAVAQIVGYSVAVFALGRSRLGVLGRIGGMSLTFIVLNSAAVVALVNFVFGKRPAWSR